MSSPFLLDTFTAAAGTTLDSHTPDTGGPATKVTGLTGSAQITSANRLRAATAGGLIGYQYAGTPTSADYDVICDLYLATLSTDSWGAGPLARIQSGAQTFYWARMVNDPSRYPAAFAGFDLYKCVAGTFTLLADSTNVTFVAGTTTRLKLSVRGSTLTLYTSSDGGATFTAVCSATDSAITTAGFAGVGMLGSATLGDSVSVQVDNLNAASVVRITPDNAAWFNSPGNWVISSSAAVSTDFGAKRSIVVSGTTSATLSFDLSALTAAGISAGDYPQIRYCIDDGPTTDVAVASTITLFTGAATSAHEIVYEFLRGNYNIDAYNTPVMAIRETGLTLGIDGSASLPADLQPDLMFVAGDSITAGLNTLANANPAGGDATATFAKALSPALKAEVGIGGKGGVGWAWAGGANVPAFTTEWKNAWSGQARIFPPLKRFVVVMGTNDGLNSVNDSAVTSAVTTWLSDARATLGTTTWIHVVIPFGGFKRAAIVAGVASYLASSPGDRADCIDLGTLFQAGLSGPYGTPTRPAPFDGIHPNILTHGQAGAALAAAIVTAETNTSSGGGTGSSHTVGGGILAGL
jgi:lysophospholipase L1-like esterase